MQNEFSRVRLHYREPGTQLTGTIHYAIGRCSLGSLLVARSSDGICAIFMDGEHDSLRSALAKAFPGNQLEEVTSTADVDRVKSFIDQPDAGVVLDVAVGGTKFQQRAWTALCEIPLGQTRSYKDVANALGLQQGARAIAGACAANVLAVAIPCHRVVHGDGSLSGYRWGVDRKRQLIAGEREHEPA
jgi:AraC family transcriptional regulator of adaptative response/methylated-DNA-[protein]-cysteine methyltransferase